MIARPDNAGAEPYPFGSSLRSPHHSFGTVPPLPCRGWHVPQGRSSASAARCLVSAILLIMAVACSRPGSWEQFVRAEDAPGGVYEFAIPSSSVIPSEAKESTFNLTFYTSPLDEPLQLEVTWLYSSAEVFPVSQKHGHQEQKPREIVPGPPSDRDTGNTLIAPVFSETVWFPAGEHRALYRSGILSEAKEAEIIQVKPIDPPADFRGLGIICKTNDGTR